MEVVSSVPLKEPGYCPKGQNRNVTELDLANNRHHTSHEVSQGQNLCGCCVLALDLGQLVSHFLYGKPVKMSLLPAAYPVLGH